jgi:hypothetical protein
MAPCSVGSERQRASIGHNDSRSRRPKSGDGCDFASSHAAASDESHSATQVVNFDTSMASAHSIREQTKLLDPNLPSANTRLIFVWGWWQLGH